MLESEVATVTSSRTVTVCISSVRTTGTRLRGLNVAAGNDLQLIGGM